MNRGRNPSFPRTPRFLVVLGVINSELPCPPPSATRQRSTIQHARFCDIVALIDFRSLLVASSRVACTLSVHPAQRLPLLGRRLPRALRRPSSSCGAFRTTPSFRCREGWNETHATRFWEQAGIEVSRQFQQAEEQKDMPSAGGWKKRRTPASFPQARGSRKTRDETSTPHRPVSSRARSVRPNVVGNVV